MSTFGEPLPPEERDALVEKIARAVVAKGLETPAILFLEMHKPLSFAASQGLIVASPLIAPLVGFDRVQSAQRLMAERQNVELLIRKIEDYAEERRREAQAAKKEAAIDSRK
jgi:hypothetical protein